jgi:hypothetical protein
MLHLFLNRVDDLQKPIDNPENINWESYARGAVYALQNNGYDLKKVNQLHLSITLFNNPCILLFLKHFSMISRRVL